MQNSLLCHIQTSLVCNSETFTLIRVIDRLLWRTGRGTHFLLHFIRHPNDHSGSGSGLVSNFSFFITWSILHVDTCVIPLWKAVLMGYILSSTPKSSVHCLGTLWPKTKKLEGFWLVAVSFLHTESNVICLLKAPINTFISASYISKVWAT